MLVIAATERELALLEGADTFCCGIGPVEAAIGTARAIAERAPDAVLHVGIAGARGIEPPALVLGNESVYCDLAAEIPTVNRALPDASLLERVRVALPDVLVLPIGTSAAVGGGAYDVEAMEGFGVLRACELAGIPAVELRAISNAIGELDRSKWRFDAAFAALAGALERLGLL